MKLKQYSDKSIVITCEDTGSEDYEKDIEYLTGIGGKFNKFLKGGGGWVFPNYRRKEIENYMEKNLAFFPVGVHPSIYLALKSEPELSNGPDGFVVPLPAPGRSQLKCYGGNLTLAQFRGAGHCGDREAASTFGSVSPGSAVGDREEAARDPLHGRANDRTEGGKVSPIHTVCTGIGCVSDNIKRCNCIVYINMLTEKLDLAYLKIKKIEEEIFNIKNNISQKYTAKKVLCEGDREAASTFGSDRGSGSVGDLAYAASEDDKPVRKRLLLR